MSDTLSFSVSEKIQTEDGLAYSGPVHYRKNKSLYSVYPCTSYLSFGYWIYLVPPFIPESVLMLGYAGGTVAGLIQKLYGTDVPITAVDLEIIDNRYGVDLIKADARDFVKLSKEYDCVILDIFNEQKTPAFVYDLGFIEQIARITKRFLTIYAEKDAPISNYEQYFNRQRLLDIGNKVYYFQPKHSQANYFPPQW